MIQTSFLILLLVLLAGCSNALDLANYEQTDTTETAVPASVEVPGSEATLLSALYGLDDDIPSFAGRVICKGAAGKDGMPVVFSHEVDTNTVQAGDFRVTRADGSTGTIVCATPAPASDAGELRTLLLIGDLGSADNQPVQVDIVGNILSMDGSMNFRGNSVSVIPLEDGPVMVFAEIVPAQEWDLGKPQASGLRFGAPGSGCPEGTQQVVRVVWAGGTTKPGGDEVDDVERQAYQVFVDNERGGEAVVTPIAVADLGDGDNNHELCLDITANPVRVAFPAGLITDPREDLNPATSVTVAK
ncbi:MAG: hypothetical protein AAGA91_07580 [Pseudomonadota bacterium]